MNRTKKKQEQNIEFCGGNYALIPLLLVIFLVPLIMRVYLYDSGLTGFTWYPDRTPETDVFLYWKGILLASLAAIMTIILVVKLAKNFTEILREYWIYFLLGYGLLALISTIASPYRHFGFSGIYEQFESIWVILSYVVVSLYTAYIVRNDEDLRVVRKAFFYLIVVLCFLGVMQLIGHDFFESDLGRRILVPEGLAIETGEGRRILSAEEIKDMRDGLSYSFSGSGIHQVYMTLYNPNYVGAFASLLLPIMVILAIASKKVVNKIAWGILSLILLVCTFGSGSKTFILSLGVVAIIAVIFCRKIIIKYWKYTLAAIAVVAICGTAYFSYMNVNLFQYVKNALIVPKSENLLENFEVTENSAIITYKGEKLTVQYLASEDGIYFIFSDENGTILEQTTLEDGLIQVNDERFQEIRFLVYAGTEEYPYFPAAVINGTPLLFTATENGYRYVNSCAKIDDFGAAESALFTDYEHFASGRGYIWSRTIPILKKTLILGTGADSFSLAFPQNDYLGRFNAGYNNSLITKPHNLYLQIGVQQGVLGLICFLVACLLYFIQSCKLYWKADLSNFRHIFGIGVMLGVTGYLISGIANDSCVALAPLFWVLLGLGYAINRMNKRKQEEAEL